MRKLFIFLFLLLLIFASPLQSDDVMRLKFGKITDGKVQLPDGAIYDGEFKRGLFHGDGILRWSNGKLYEGTFKNGLRHGHGKSVDAIGNSYEGEYLNGFPEGTGITKYSNGDVYKGEHKYGEFFGQGIYKTKSGRIYEGEFKNGRANGKGKIVMPKRGVYVGDIKDWKMHGEGVLTVKKGKVTYSGEFFEGTQSGKGEIVYRKGSRYKGEIKNWKAQGYGEANLKNGNRYVGEFDNNKYHGKGTMYYKNGNKYTGGYKKGLKHGKGEYIRAKPMGRKKELHGYWSYGDYVGETPPDKSAKEKKKSPVDAEAIFYSQNKLLQNKLGKITPGDPNKIELYVLNFASYGGQDVFMKEANYSEKTFKKHFKTSGRSISLINNHKVAQKLPLASVTNLKVTLAHLAKKMDREQDVLFMYLTSHGSKKHELAVSLRGLPLNDLPAKKLADIIKNSGIKWKVIVVSACYSGGFINQLKDEHTMVMTASKLDHVSFGCSDEAEFTYFGRALLKEALPESQSFVAAFHKAKVLVTQWEAKEKYDHSQPQLWSTDTIESYLARWRNQATERVNVSMTSN